LVPGPLSWFLSFPGLRCRFLMVVTVSSSPPSTTQPTFTLFLHRPTIIRGAFLLGISIHTVHYPFTVLFAGHALFFFLSGPLASKREFSRFFLEFLYDSFNAFVGYLLPSSPLWWVFLGLTNVFPFWAPCREERFSFSFCRGTCVRLFLIQYPSPSSLPRGQWLQFSHPLRIIVSALSPPFEQSFPVSSYRLLFLRSQCVSTALI